MVKKQKNITIEIDLLNKLMHKAVDLNMSDSQLICRYIEEGLKRDDNQTTLDDKIE